MLMIFVHYIRYICTIHTQQHGNSDSNDSCQINTNSCGNSDSAKSMAIAISRATTEAVVIVIARAHVTVKSVALVMAM